MTMDTGQAGIIILTTLRLAKNRLAGTLEEKEIRRERLDDLIARVVVHGDKPEAEGRPAREELTEALGDPDDGEIRAALAAW